MKQVVRYIERRAQDGRRHPFIQWLEDESVPSRERLSKWLKDAAVFVFGFADLHSMILPYPESEAAGDEVKKAINSHAEEDANHWGWYLGDIQKLGLDQELKFSDTLQLLWGERTKMQRLATYRLCQLAGSAEDPMLRCCLIKAIEAFGEIIFETVARVSHQFEKETGIRLEYLGDIHAEREAGGLQHDEDEVEGRIFAIELDEARQSLGLEIAKETCDVIEKRWHEFHRSVTSS